MKHYTRKAGHECLRGHNLQAYSEAEITSREGGRRGQGRSTLFPEMLCRDNTTGFQKGRVEEGEPRSMTGRDEVHFLQKEVQNVLEGEQENVALIPVNLEESARFASYLNSGLKAELID